MKFSDYDKENNGDVREKDWQSQYDFDLGHLVSEARLYAGWTQKQLAEKMGTQQPGVARVEGGSVLPGHDFLKRMALAIDAPLMAPKFKFMEHVEHEGTSLGSKTSEQEMLSELKYIFARPTSISLTSNRQQ
jgi:transcriptional regulator with XRE-family HTH domain